MSESAVVSRVAGLWNSDRSAACASVETELWLHPTAGYLVVLFRDLW